MFERASHYYIQNTIYSHDRFSMSEAIQKNLERKVIFNQIQLYYSDAQETLRDCEREIRKWCSFSHKNLPNSIDGWAEEKRLVFVYQIPNGVNLNSLILDQTSLSEKQIPGIALQMASVLNYIHQNGLYHGILTADCFWLAYETWIILIRSSLPEFLNRTFEKADTGLKHKINVKKLKGKDIAAWGAILGALLTGDPYFGFKKDISTSPHEIELKDRTIRSVNPRVSGEFEDIILKSLHSFHYPDKGYASFEAVLEDLTKIEQGFFVSPKRSSSTQKEL